MYTTPVYSGFKATGEYSFGNNNSTTVTNNTNTIRVVSFQYNQGPLNAIYARGNAAAPSNGAAGATTTLGTTPPVALPADTDITWNILAANYKISDVTLMGGLTSTKHNAPVVLEDSKSWNVAAKYTLNPKIEFLANYLVRNSNLANTADAKLIGLGTNYFLDTATNLYVRYEGQRFTAAGATPAQNQNIWAVGVRYQF